ncbi:MAG: glucose 1-dehydrogenase [Gammaproteobacteria bacterium]|nr:glucose 1-dehydrogenase [Gammaproteobacteria bacterium]
MHAFSADLSQKIALVTGASSGLGIRFAHALAAHGARVVLAARNEAALEQVRADIERSGGRALAVRMDVTDRDSIEQAFETARAKLGVIDVCVNNSGITTTRPSLELEESDWDSVIDTNLKGAWMVANEAARRLVAAEQPGSIINIASILAFRAAGVVTSYMASKAGLVHLTRGLALEWARHRIRVNAIAPGYFATEMNRDFWDTAPGQAMIKRIPQRRLGQVEELDGPLLLLASDASSYMTGSTIVVDGGHLQSTL